MKGHEPRIISWPGAQEGSLRTPKGQAGSWDPVSPGKKATVPSVRLGPNLGAPSEPGKEKKEREAARNPLIPEGPPIPCPLQMTKGGEGSQVSEEKQGTPEASNSCHTGSPLAL